MRVRRRRDVHHVRPCLLEQRRNGIVDARDLEPRGRLPREIDVAITDADRDGIRDLPELLQVGIGDLPAAYQSNTKGLFSHALTVCRCPAPARRPRREEPKCRDAG